MVYNLIPSFNATVNDVQYPVAYTIVATLITYVLMFAPFVFPVKTYGSLWGRPGKYTKTDLRTDLILSWLMFTCLLAVFISSWAGYTTILAQFRPNDETSPVYGIQMGQETFWLVVSCITTAFFASYMMYRTLVYSYSSKDRISITENDVAELSETTTKLTAPEGIDNEAVYWERVDEVKYRFSSFFRIFCMVFFTLSFLMFVTIYPYSVNGHYLVSTYFFVTSQFQLVTGIILSASFVFGLISSAWQKKHHAYDTYISRLFNNTDVVSHSYANSFFGFTLAGHIITIEVGKWWIMSFIAFMFNVIYTITCSVEKAQTFFFAVLMVVLIGTCCAQRRGVFIPFLFAAMWPYSTVPYLIEFSNPPNSTVLMGQPQINTNYLTTAPNCTVAKMDEDGTLIFGLAIFAFVISLFAFFEVSMSARGSKILERSYTRGDEMKQAVIAT